MENPIKMDDLGVPPFKETPIWLFPSKSSRELFKSKNTSEVQSCRADTGHSKEACGLHGTEQKTHT